MQALAPLLVLVATAAGTVEVPLDVSLDVAHRAVASPSAPPASGPAPAAAPPAAARAACGWRVERGAARLRCDGPTWRAEVTLAAGPDRPGVDIAVAITYLADVHVAREVLELRLPAERLRAAWRDGRLRDAPALLRIDRWTPRVCLVRSRGVDLVVDGGEVEGLEVGREPGRAVIRLELDDEEDHPFDVESACVRRWRRSGPAVPEGARLRLAGERVVYRARLYRGDAPLLVDRAPAGRRAVVVFSDHADQTGARTLRALLDGASSPRAPGHGKGGFLGHGLPLTKAFFWRNAPGQPQLESGAVRGLAERLRAGGGEVALHSPTPERDRRQRVAAALKALRPFDVRTWIDHQPPTNCEAFADRGWRPDRNYGIVDLLAAAGIRYVWAARGEPKPEDDFNLLRPGEPAARTPLIYPWAAPTREARGAGLYLFRSAWAYVDRDLLYSLLAPPRLDRLEEERGVAILHTYLEAMRRDRRLRPRNLMVRDPRTGVVALDPAFDAILADLARRQQAGRVWVTTVRDLGDHLRGVGALEVRYARDGSARLRNAGLDLVRGVTLRLARPGARLAAPGAAGARADADGPTLWLDLAPGVEVPVTARDAAGRAVPFVGEATFRFGAGRASAGR